MSRNAQPDLFSTQPDLFGAPPRPSYTPSLERVRTEVNKVLDTARNAKVLPWKPKELAYWKTVFPQMTKWLPQDEAAQMRFAFMEELRRLKAA